MSPSFNPMSSSPSSPNPQSPAPAGRTLISRLDALHLDEFAYLAKSASNLPIDSEQSWLAYTVALFKAYVSFIFVTWKRAVWALFFYPNSSYIFSLPLNVASVVDAKDFIAVIMDRISLFLMTIGLCAVMTLFLVFCILAEMTLIVRLVASLSRFFYGGLNVLNACKLID